MVGDYSFNSVWGTYSGDSKINNGDIVGNLQQDTVEKIIEKRTDAMFVTLDGTLHINDIKFGYDENKEIDKANLMKQEVVNILLSLRLCL